MTTKTVTWGQGENGNYTFGSPDYNTIVYGSPPNSYLNNLVIKGVVYFEGSDTVTITGNLDVYSDLTIGNGTSFVVHSKLRGRPESTITLSAGSRLVYERSDNNTTIKFGALNDGETSTLEILGQEKITENKILDLVPNAIIKFTNDNWGNTLKLKEIFNNNVVGSNVYQIIDEKYSILLASYVTLAKGVSPSDFHWDSSSNSIACFLAGSMIRTPLGEIAVENIRIGDKVSALEWRNDTETDRTVIWVGHQKAVVRPELSDDEAGYPVCVLKDAVADNIPYKDMLITAEHCLFFEGNFVPVRMLVNGRSIFYDKSFTSYIYYHIETEPHSVIIADGMHTESYLDTGNRRNFRQDAKVIAFPQPRQQSRYSTDIKRTVERDIVEPLYRQIKARAQRFGRETAIAPLELTTDPALCLTTEKGQIIHPERRQDDCTIFMIPPEVENLYIISRTSRPSDTIGPFVADRRRLGVLIGEITLTDSKVIRRLDAHLTQDDLAGWEVMEASDQRWTNGNALLPLGKCNLGSHRILSLQIKAAGPYLVADTPSEAMAIQASDLERHCQGYIFCRKYGHAFSSPGFRCDANSPAIRVAGCCVGLRLR